MLSYLVVALVGLVPGALLGFAVPPGRERWIAWAAAPILTLGLAAAAMAWLPVIGLPSGALWVLAAEILLAVLTAAASWLAAGWRGRGRRVAASPATERVMAAVSLAGGPTPDPARAASGGADNSAPSWQAVAWRHWLPGGIRRPQLAADLAGVVVPVAIAVATGGLLLRRVAWPPGWDAMNHGMLTRNIMETGSTMSSAVCTSGQPLPHISCHFYPLGADVSWAQTAILSGGRISAVMLAWSVLLGPAALVTAVYAAVRAFGGSAPVASAAAISPVLLSPMWPSLLSGRPQETFAPGMGIAVAVLAALAIRGKYPVRLGVLAGLGTAGLVVTHTYDILFAAVLTLAFLAAGLLAAPRDRPGTRLVVTGLAATAAAVLAACAPMAGPLLGARGERSASVIRILISWPRAWHYWVTSPRHYVLLGTSPYGGTARLHLLPVQAALWLTVLCLLASPLCLGFRELRWARPWLFTWVAWTVLGIWTSISGSRAAEFLASLWYGEAGRLRMMAYPVQGVVAIAGACAIGLCMLRLAAAIRRSSALRLERMTAAVAAGTLAVILIGLAAVPGVHRTVERQYRKREPVGAAYARVFSWLHRHTSPGMVVAYNRNVDYMIWSYADYGVPGLFGIAPRVRANWPDDAARQQAWRWLIGTPGVQPAGCLVRRYRIEYVATGSQHLPEPLAFPRTMNYSLSRLAATPNVTLAHQDQGIRVYRVTSAGAACPGSAHHPPTR